MRRSYRSNRLVRAICAGSLLLAALLAAKARAAENAGTSDLLSTPAGWPTVGAASGFTGTALDPLAIYLNPAGLAVQDERSLLVHHGLLAFSTSWDLAAVSYPIPGLGGVGLGFARLGSGGIDAYDAGNRPLGTIDYRETSAAASFARRIRGPVWAGLTFKILGQSLGDLSASAPALDAGILVRPAALRGGQIGLSAQNVAAGSLNLGGETPALDRTIRVGVGSPEWRLNALTSARVVADLATRGSEGVQPKLGVECARSGLGAVRAGFSNGGPVFGLGFRFRRYGFDYAYQSGGVEATQQFAVRLNWGEPISRYEARRTAELRRAAEDSIRVARAGEIARDRAKAEAAEQSGDWEGALVLWQVLQRSDPSQPSYASRADHAREELAGRADRAVQSEGEARVARALAAMARSALARGDVEEAAGLARGITGLPADSAAALTRDVAAARDRAADEALAKAETLERQGNLLDASREVALALRLKPEDARAAARWSSLQASLGKSAAEAQTLGRKLQALAALNEVSRAYAEGRYADAKAAVQKALVLDPTSSEARDWRDRIERRLSTPKPELDARIKELYIKGMEAFTAGDYREALRNWEQILVLDPLNESARRNVLEARERMKSETRR